MSHGSTEVFPVGGVRTPQGRYGGAPTAVRASEPDPAVLVGTA